MTQKLQNHFVHLRTYIVAGTYSRHVAHPTFKALFLSTEESEELAIAFFEKNKDTKNMDVDCFNNLLKALIVGCQLATHFLPTTTHHAENDRFLHKLANEELTTEILTLYDGPETFFCTPSG